MPSTVAAGSNVCCYAVPVLERAKVPAIGCALHAFFVVSFNNLLIDYLLDYIALKRSSDNFIPVVLYKVKQSD